MSDNFQLVDWAKGSNIYEVNVRQYTKEGTFKASEKVLPRLRDMEVDILWFMPITPISKAMRQGSLGNYYACSNYNQTNPEFGSLQDFKELVIAAHKLQFKVIIDWVGNHTGYDHVWTRTNPEYYKKNDQGEFYDSNGWTDVIDLDYSNFALQEAMVEAMRFWISECNIDGFRCDMAHLVPLSFWQKARIQLDELKDLFWPAETEDASYHAVFDATYAWQFLHAMEAVAQQKKGLPEVLNVLNEYKDTFPSNALRAFFTSNHDENSHSGSEYERLGDAAKAFAVLCATLPGSIPLIYSGQELPNKKRLRFFDKDELEWTQPCKLHSFYKTLLSLRKSNAALSNGSMLFLDTTAPDSALVYILTSGNNQVLVVLNLSSRNNLKFEVLGDTLTGSFTNAFLDIRFDLDDRRFEMQAWEYRVYYKR